MGFNWYDISFTDTQVTLTSLPIRELKSLAFFFDSLFEVSLSRFWFRKTYKVFYMWRRSKKSVRRLVFRWLTSIHEHWSRKTFHFIFPSRSQKWKKLREAPCVVVMLCERFARGRAFCFMNFYISMEKSKQKKKKLYSLWSIISIEETHLLYKTSAKKSAAHCRADFKTGHKYPKGLKIEKWKNLSDDF